MALVPVAAQAGTAQFPSSRVALAVAQWNVLRQSDRLPFSTYASFLTRYRGWPGENGLRKSAERAIDPMTASPAEVAAYFRLLPPVTAVGYARHAFALLATGQADAARAQARLAWRAGALPRADEDRLLAQFAANFQTEDHDQRMEVLLASKDLDSARRTLGYASPARRPIFEVRIALQTRAADASTKLAALGTLGIGDSGLLMDRARWLRDSGQSQAARSLLAQPHALVTRPADPERWFETMLAMARGAAADRQWTLAYQIASQVDDAYPPGTDVSDRSMGERDDYTSLTWLAGTVALHQLGRPADAMAMFLRYARGGRSTQVLSKGLYWAGRAAQAAGQPAQANAFFAEASAYPELFYGQLSLERLGLPIPVPPALEALPPPAPALRAAFQRRDVVEAIKLLGQYGRWDDQSLFIRSLSEQLGNSDERILATELARQIGRPDLRVWLARSARNAGSPFFTREAYPQVAIPPAQQGYWSLAHGIIRQESSFDSAAVSPAGARGMMQLMTPTARHIATKISMPYELARLTSDPQYNIMLGSSYFAELMDRWGGYAPLAIASYNAGASNVSRWITANGDPRLPGADIVKWIEDIPFTETRGYVQHVLENAVIYDTLNPSQVRVAPGTRLSFYLGKSGRPG
ncbi:MAG TPA: lytic transglycosylase domain-containing protein [Allosphingosinicella sp.]|nr:lytic transglycosylase domain-containing protein [Allosphingosinicella sp.]